MAIVEYTRTDYWFDLSNTIGASHTFFEKLLDEMAMTFVDASRDLKPLGPSWHEVKQLNGIAPFGTFPS